MRFPPGTQVWIKCDDDVWWPAKVKETDAEMQAFLCSGEDCCVEFYHTPGELYPLVSTDDSRVRPFHAKPDMRTAAEATWFENAEVRPATVKAVRDYQRHELLNAPPPAPPSLPPLGDAPSPPSASATAPAAALPTGATAVSTPFSAAELRNIQTLLDAVGTDTSTQLRQQLRQARVSVSSKDVHRQEARERQARKRERPPTQPIAPPAAATAATAALKASVLEWRDQLVAPPAAKRKRGAAPPLAPPVPTPPTETHARAAPSFSSSSEMRQASSASAHSSPTSSSPAHSSSDDTDDDGAAVPFVPAARRHVLEVLRREVFDDPSKFVLSPVYHFVEMLGAIAVDNASLTTTLPSPHAVHETPTGGFSPHRRVLLVPLTETYAHTTGWMVPMEIEGERLSMSLSVNDTPVPLPANWQLSPAKEATAVKTAVVVDITDLVLGTGRELFALQVVFSGNVEEVEMWRGVIACVFVEEVGLARLGESIVSTYRRSRVSAARRSPSNSRGGAVDLTEASVRVQCPITTLPMEIPVRGVYCEHLQCMEMAAVLIQCVRQNVWNCPLCSASMKPEDVCVNYRLKDWIASHRQQLAEVEYVVETASASPLKIVYKHVPQRDKRTFEVVDEDGD